MNSDDESESGLPRIRSCPEDFIVEEIPLYPPSHEGGHTFVLVEKRLRTTEEVARELARAAGKPPRDVGYAGRKDRNAVTRQWFSVPGLSPDDALSLELSGARVLEAVAHGHKLRTGQLVGNRFEIRVRGVDDVLEEKARMAMARIVERGMPNRYGVQRFGRDGKNSERARRLLAGERIRVDRRQARFLVSALQAEVFNCVLAQRPRPLETVEVGDVARLTESGGLFIVEDKEVENERAARFEISATGPIFGTRMKQPTGEVARREALVMAGMGVPAAEDFRSPPGVRVRGARRAVRVQPGEASLRREEDALLLSCSLPAGSYVTVLLEEIFGRLAEGSM